MHSKMHKTLLVAPFSQLKKWAFPEFVFLCFYKVVGVPREPFLAHLCPKTFFFVKRWNPRFCTFLCVLAWFSRSRASRELQKERKKQLVNMSFFEMHGNNIFSNLRKSALHLPPSRIKTKKNTKACQKQSQKKKLKLVGSKTKSTAPYLVCGALVKRHILRKA